MSNQTNSVLESRAYQIAIPPILEAVRALIPPSPTLFYECNRERLAEHAEKLAALDLELGNLRKVAFAAGIRLLSLRKTSITTGERHDLAH